MPRTKNTFDTFTAIAEPKRRTLIERLAGDELSVNQLVEYTHWNQPLVSKHLRVLKEAGLVAERRSGRQRLYQVNVDALRPVQHWVQQFEQFWTQSFDQLDDYLVELQNKGVKDE